MRSRSEEREEKKDLERRRRDWSASNSSIMENHGERRKREE